MSLFVTMVTMYIKVKVQPSAKMNLITKTSDGVFMISVTARTSHGAANKAVLSALRSFFGDGVILKMVKGPRSRSKIISVEKNERKNV